MRPGQLGVAGGFALLGTVMITGTADMKAVAHIEYGPGLFPTIVGWLMIALAAVAAIDALRLAAPARPETGADEAVPAPPNYPLFAGVVLAPIVYVLLANPLGFLLTMALIVAGLVWLASGRLVQALVFGVVLTLVLHVIFYQVLRVTLPWGILTPFAGILTWR